jgi:hypothetical protein
MESIDRLLAELKAEYQESQKKFTELKAQKIVQAEPSLEATAVPSGQAMVTSSKNLDFGTFDSDLAQIKAEYEKQDQAQEVGKQELVKAEYEAQNQVQKIVKQEQQQVETVVQQQVPVRTHREKVRQAQVWLKNLSKDSDERFWFDQFAFKYSSRIDAAIDYLQAVNEFD